MKIPYKSIKQVLNFAQNRRIILPINQFFLFVSEILNNDYDANNEQKLELIKQYYSITAQTKELNANY